jgi:hypothetical protein
VVIFSTFSVPNQTWVCGENGLMYYIIETTTESTPDTTIASLKDDCESGCGGT